MYIEKYKLIGFTYEENELKDIIKNNPNNYYTDDKINMSFELQLIKEYKRNFIFHSKSFFTKKEAINELEIIRYNYTNVDFWSILSVLIDVPVVELRKRKIKNIVNGF